MRRVVVTAAIGEAINEIAALSLPTISAYASRIGVDFYLIQESPPRYRDWSTWWSKFYIYELLRKYDEGMWIDCDTIVSPRAPNIFEVAGGKFSAYVEGDIVKRVPVFREYWAVMKGWIVPEPRLIKYVNAGVFVIPASENKILLPPSEAEISTTEKIHRFQPGRFLEQDFINLRLIEFGVKVNSLPDVWNTMQISENWECRKERSYIIHYAGFPRGKTPSMMREDLMRF